MAGLSRSTRRAHEALGALGFEAEIVEAPARAVFPLTPQAPAELAQARVADVAIRTRRVALRGRECQIFT